MAVRAGRAEPKGQQGRQAGRAGQAAASNLLEWFSQGLGASRETALSVNQSKGEPLWVLPMLVSIVRRGEV